MSAERSGTGWALLASGALHALLALVAWQQGPDRLQRAAPRAAATAIQLLPMRPQPRPVPPPTAPTLAPPAVALPAAPAASPAAATDRPTAAHPPLASAAPRTGAIRPSAAPADREVRLTARPPGPTAPAAGSGIPVRHEPQPQRPPATTTPPSTGRIDLFPADALCKTIGCASGTPGEAGSALRAHLAAEQAEREGIEAVRSGRVDPLWREIERDVEKTFAPPEKSVTSASRGELALRQLARQVKPAPEQTQTGWLLNMDASRRLQAEVRAVQDAIDEPAVGREAEVEAELDAQGEVVAVRLARGSGHRQFDAEALRAVRQALRLRPLHDPQGAVIARYALRGEVAVNLPRFGMVVEPNSGLSHTPTLSLAGTFDEVTGKADVRIPFLKRLKKTIRLLSVRRRLPAP